MYRKGTELFLEFDRSAVGASYFGGTQNEGLESVPASGAGIFKNRHGIYYSELGEGLSTGIVARSACI